MATVDPADLVWIDESGSHIGMTPTHARAPRGERVWDDVPRNRGVVTTMIGALTTRGLATVMTIEGGTDAEVFQAFVEQELSLVLRPGMTVVLDNAGAHKVSGVLAAITACGAQVRFLPPYSPEFNPIEMAWSKLKTLLRKAKARTREALDTAIAAAMKAIDAQDSAGWIRASGYAIEVP